jgi:hypothetical protein
MRPMDRRQALERVALAATPALGGCVRDDYTFAARDTWRPLAVGERAPATEWVRAATLAANSLNAQPWRFRILSRAIEILPDAARRTPVLDPDGHHLWVSLGCAAENLVQAAAGDRHTLNVAFAVDRIRLDLDGPRAQGALADAITARQSSRTTFDGRPLAPHAWHLLEHALDEPGVQWRWLERRGDIERVVEAAAEATRAQVADAAYRAELKQWLRFGEAEALQQRDGLFAAASGHPVLPRWLGARLFDFGFNAAAETERLARQLRSVAGVLVLATAPDAPAGWVAAGRACQRVLLQATALELRSAFACAPVEVAPVRAQFAAALGLAPTRPDVVLLLGHGTRLPRSLRRPLDAVLVRDGA